MITARSRLTFFAISVASILFAFIFLNTGTVNAAGFPGTEDVAIPGPNSGLDFRTGHYRIMGNGQLDINLEGACESNTAGTPGMRARYNGVWKSSNGDCVGNDLRFNNVPPNQNLLVEKINGQGHESFSLEVTGPGASVSQLGNPNRDRPATRANGLYNDIDNYGFAAWMGNGKSYKFSTPCNHDEGQTVYIRWRDVDVGNYNQPNLPKFKFREIPRDGSQPYTWTPPQSRLGGDGENRQTFDWLYPNSDYEFIWDDTSAINAIAMVLPYADTLEGACPPQNNQTAEPTCDRFERNLYPHANYRFTVFGFDQNYVASSPAEGQVRNSQGSWKSFTQAPANQVSRSNSSDNFDLWSFAHNAPAGPGWKVYVEKWTHLANGDWQYNSDVEWTGNCYSGTPINPITGACSIRFVTGGSIPNNSQGTTANSIIGFTARIYNTGGDDLPASSRGANLGITIAGPDWGGSVFPAGSGIPRGQFKDVYFQVTAPNDMSRRTVTAYPDYNGLFAVGPACSTYVDIYQRYDFEATANSALVPDSENPAGANLITNIQKTGTADVNATATRQWFKRRNAANSSIGGPFAEARAFVAAVPYYTDYYAIPPGSFTLGDGYCVSINIDRGHGWRGPFEQYYNEAADYDDNCAPGELPKVENKPYVRAYGADVMAGGGFGANCSRTNSGILAYISPLGTQAPSPGDPDGESGSGASLAAFALGPISGFMSAAARQTGAQSPQGLTFSHTNTLPTQTGNNPVLGGNMAGDGWCSPDYYEITQFTDDANKTTENSNTPLSIMGLNDDEQTVKAINGAMIRIQSSNSANYNRQHTVYVDGDAFISNNIMYDQSLYNSLDAIPSFTLIVKGNIYIDRDVSQLDGLYIAQPRNGDPNSGRIYTCALGAPTYAPVITRSQVFTECGGNDTGNRRQLTVNGAFVAQRVILNRAGYSLRDSTYREQYSPAAKAAETFVFSPEMYLSPPVFRPTGTATGGDYQSIQILAPFL